MNSKVEKVTGVAKERILEKISGLARTPEAAEAAAVAEAAVVAEEAVVAEAAEGAREIHTDDKEVPT
jgi:hypothetical protein